MMVALEGQHTAKQANAFSNRMPWASNRARGLGIYLRSSLRMSSVRMKTKLGLLGVVGAAVGVLPVTADKNSSATAAEANSRPVFLIFLYLSLAGQRRKVSLRPGYVTRAAYSCERKGYVR